LCQVPRQTLAQLSRLLLPSGSNRHHRRKTLTPRRSQPYSTLPQAPPTQPPRRSISRKAAFHHSPLRRKPLSRRQHQTQRHKPPHRRALRSLQMRPRRTPPEPTIQARLRRRMEATLHQRRRGKPRASVRNGHATRMRTLPLRAPANQRRKRQTTFPRRRPVQIHRRKVLGSYRRQQAAERPQPPTVPPQRIRRPAPIHRPQPRPMRRQATPTTLRN